MTSHSVIAIAAQLHSHVKVFVAWLLRLDRQLPRELNRCVTDQGVSLVQSLKSTFDRSSKHSNRLRLEARHPLEVVGMCT
jgi:hypothetical protein